MKTVKDIISAVYGDDHATAKAHKVKRTSVCNWKAWGHFPALRLHRLLLDAKAAGVPLDLADIPLTKAAA